MKYWWFVFAVLCALVFWFTLFTPNLHYSYSENHAFYVHTINSTNTTNRMDIGLDVNKIELIMNNASICTTSLPNNEKSILVMVHTARPNFEHRDAIRNTWGSVKVWQQWRLYLIFLLGLDPKSSEYDAKLREEHKEHGDTIMGNFTDTYQNLTYKHLMGYKWVETFCPTAKFILKTDDDMFADIFKVVEVLLPQLNNTNQTYACENMRGNNPIRIPSSKWYVSKEHYESDTYPEYCSGSAYLMKADDAFLIYSASKTTKFLWVDDAFVTGVLREKSQRGILTLRGQHHLGNKKEIITWCTGSEKVQLSNTFILLNKNEFTHDMSCIWNKIKPIRNDLNTTVATKTS